MSNFENEVLQRLTSLETSMKSLVGNGQPGMIASLFKRVRALEDERNKFRGSLAALGAIAALIGGLLGAYLPHLLH